MIEILSFIMYAMCIFTVLCTSVLGVVYLFMLLEEFLTKKENKNV